MRGVKLALLGGLGALSIALVVTLLGSPMSVARTNRVPGNETTIWSTTHSATYCQGQEVLPGGVSAIRVWLDAAAGPSVDIAVSARGHTIASGSRSSIWIGGSVTVPVKPLPRTVHDVTVCASFHLRDETIAVQGSSTPRAHAAHDGRQALDGRMGIEYLRPDTRSWLSQAGEVARRMGLGREPAGTWVVMLALALLGAALALASRLLVRELT
jgi:hypothetical protein